MATINIPRLVGKTNKAGLTTWYWQPSKSVRAKGWAPQRLGASAAADPPEEVCTAARRLNEQVEEGAGLRAAMVRRLQRRLTVADAIRRFEDAGYPSVRRPGATVEKSTGRQYKSKLRTLEAWAGDVALTSITPERVAVFRDTFLMAPAKHGRWAGQVRHHAAHETLRVGRSFFTWCEQKGLIPRGSNPFTSFGLAQPAPRQQVWWAPAREAILAEALGEDPDESMALAVDLAFSIGQREADLLRLTIGQYVEIPSYKMDPEVHRALAGADGRVMGIRLRQAKGKTWIEVPVVGDTRARVEAQVARAKAAGVTMLLFGDDGRPWSMPNLKAGQTRFIRSFGALRAAAIARAEQAGQSALAAELAQLQFRDFRRTAVVYLGELGIPDHLIAAITGHSLDETKEILKTYMPLTTGMAARAIAMASARAPAAAQKEKKG